MSAKRKFTVPIMLVIITLLTFLIVVLFSRVLLDGQSLKTERGERLASGYNACISYAGALKSLASGLLEAKDEVARLPAKVEQGKMESSASECQGLLQESGIRSGMSEEAATSAVSGPLQKIQDKLAPIGNHAGPLTDEERTLLTAASAASDKLSSILAAYNTPTGSDRFRQMQAGVDWVPVAQNFVRELSEAAAAFG